MKNLVKNFNIIVFDSISKFNLFEKKKILKIENLKIYVKLKSFVKHKSNTGFVKVETIFMKVEWIFSKSERVIDRVQRADTRVQRADTKVQRADARA